MNRTNSKFFVKNLVLGALFLALALVLPFFTGQIPQIGAMLCPMHLPILLAGFVCGGSCTRTLRLSLARKSNFVSIKLKFGS